MFHRLCEAVARGVNFFERSNFSSFAAYHVGNNVKLTKIIISLVHDSYSELGTN